MNKYVLRSRNWRREFIKNFLPEKRKENNRHLNRD